ncbi:MAG: hypothetical protein HC786_23115 [Richelia sp. CSU_2_1]|nr:hypothetical protein [Richelia sp. CSU_2_1]
MSFELRTVFNSKLKTQNSLPIPNCQLSTLNCQRRGRARGHPLRFASPLPVNCQLSTVNCSLPSCKRLLAYFGKLYVWNARSKAT